MLEYKQIKLGKETKMGKILVKAGFPYCFQEKGYSKHCKTCIIIYNYGKTK